MLNEIKTVSCSTSINFSGPSSILPKNVLYFNPGMSKTSLNSVYTKRSLQVRTK